MKNKFSWYQCPDCGWYFDDDPYYRVKNGKVIKGYKHDGENKRLLPPNSKYKWYPIYSPYRYDYEGNPSWDETHLCPKCNKEFEFPNGV